MLGMYSDDFYTALFPSPFSPENWADADKYLTPTIRTDITREEHELLLAIREYNRAADVSNEAETVLAKAQEEADESRNSKHDAHTELNDAMRAVKHGHSDDFDFS